MKATMLVLLSLSFIAGFADTATFIHLSGLFSAHVTGNFVLLAAAIGTGVRQEDLLKLLAFPVFIIAAFLATLFHDRFQGGKAEELLDHRLGLMAGSLLLAGAVLAFFRGQPVNAGGFPIADSAAGMLSVAAMGIQNAIHRFGASLGPPTTVMTGTVTQLTVLAARKIRGHHHGSASPKAFSLSGLLRLALAFAAGCAFSVPATIAIGLTSLAVPGLLLIAASLSGRKF